MLPSNGRSADPKRAAFLLLCVGLNVFIESLPSNGSTCHNMQPPWYLKCHTFSSNKTVTLYACIRDVPDSNPERVLDYTCLLVYFSLFQRMLEWHFQRDNNRFFLNLFPCNIHGYFLATFDIVEPRNVPEIRKVKLSLCLINYVQRHEHAQQSGGRAHPFLTSALDGQKWSASHPSRFIPRERAPGTHWLGDWVGRSGRCETKKNLLPLPGIKPRPSRP
jgi:hypothetical protein